MKTISAKPGRPRGRPRSFDRETALENAMEVFWKHGYEATSINDLTAAMGINPPSLYAAFGDKERLFMEAIERYQQQRAEALELAFESERTARGAVERLLKDTAERLADCGEPRGCMLVMSTTNCSAESAHIQDAVAKRRFALKARLKARIDRAVKEGELPRGTDTTALTDFYGTVIQGMSMQARDGASCKSLLATVETAMRAWPGETKLRTATKPARAGRAHN
jgi:TetR/AcrR family transcriptional regulator, copper-responsive repressor